MRGSPRRVVTEFIGDGADLNRELDTLERKTGRLSGFMGKAGKAIALGLAGGLVVAGGALAGMTKNAVEDEAAQRKLAVAMHNSVGATDRQVASVERWIAKQGTALGVTDDELRPAFQRLVQATGDVDEAQRQLGLAMDVSAGTGKSLKVVSEALMKANNGTTASLSKLGLKTKDADGNTLSLNQALEEMSKTFGGQASQKAATLEGKMDRLKIIMDETKETIGAKLIPVLTSLADWVLNKAVPAVEQFVHEWEDGIGTAGQVRDILERVGSAVQDVAGFLWDHKVVVASLVAGYVAYRAVMLVVNAVQAVQLLLLKAHTVGTVQHTVVTKTAAAATKTWAAMQWLLNAAMTANPIGLAIAAVALLAAGLVIAYKKSETFRNMVTGAMDAVGDAFRWFWNNVGQPVVKFFVEGLARIIEMFADLLGAMSHVPGFGWLKPLAASMHAAADRTKELANNIRDIPPRKTVTISVQVANQYTLDHVEAQLDRLDQHGRRARPGFGLSKVGVSLIDSIVKGIDKGKVKLQTALESVNTFIQRHQDRLADLLDKKSSVVEAFRGFTDSIFSTDLTSGEGEGPATIDRLLAAGAAARAKAEQLRDNVQALIAKGLSKELLQDLVNNGAQGQEQINLLAGGNADQIAQANANQAAIQAALEAAGLAAGGALYDDQISKEKTEIRVAQEIKKVLERWVDKFAERFEVRVYMDGDQIHAALLKKKRRGGGIDLGLA